MRPVLIAALLAAVPAAASDPAFRIGIACSDNGVPLLIEIHATRAGQTTLTLEEMLEFCAERKPVKRGTAI